MAHRATGYWRSILQQQNSRSFSTAIPHREQRKLWGKTMAEWAPIGIVLGMVVVASAIAMRTGYQQLVHNPNVYVYKKKRETIPELDEPTKAVKTGGKYVDKSVLRKIAHIQDDKPKTMPNPVQGSIYTRPKHAETLDSIKD